MTSSIVTSVSFSLRIYSCNLIPVALRKNKQMKLWVEKLRHLPAVGKTLNIKRLKTKALQFRLKPWKNPRLWPNLSSPLLTWKWTTNRHLVIQRTKKTASLVLRGSIKQVKRSVKRQKLRLIILTYLQKKKRCVTSKRLDWRLID